MEERSTHRELDCFLGVGNRDGFEEEVLVNEAAGDGFALFWEAVIGPEVEAFCYELKPLELGKRTNSCIGVNTRELNRELFTK